MNPKPTVSEQLRNQRDRLNLTQQEAAKRVGVSVRLYANWERGKIARPTTPEMALKTLTLRAAKR